MVGSGNFVVFNIILLLSIFPDVLLTSMRPSDTLVQGCSSEIPGHRCVPDDPCWPSQEQWNALNESVHGRLTIPHLTVEPCFNLNETTIDGESCERSLHRLGEDPFYLQQFPGGVQSTGTCDICAYLFSP